MTALHLATVQSEDAHAAAYRDRERVAVQILDVAVKDAVAAIRDGRPGWAAYRLTRAGLAADRILGTHSQDRS